MTPRVIGVVVATVIGVTSCSLGSSPPVWDEAEQAVMALPVPPGFTDAGLSRRGGEGDDSCGSPAGCAAPSVTRTFRSNEPTGRPEACERLRAALPSWQSAGYQFVRWNESASDGLQCNLAGSMNGLNTGADVSTSGEIRLSALAIEK